VSAGLVRQIEDMDFLLENIKWVFSGIGVAIMLAVVSWVRRRIHGREHQVVGGQSQTTTDSSLALQAGRDIVFNQPQATESSSIRVRVHQAYFINKPDEHFFFINVVNCCQTTDVEITHVWYENSTRVDVLEPRRRLPRRLRPKEPWETWIRTASVPFDPNAYTSFRVRISTGEIFTSEQNHEVPPRGFVPGT
jgi:hypothetical protein